MEDLSVFDFRIYLNSAGIGRTNRPVEYDNQPGNTNLIVCEGAKGTLGTRKRASFNIWTAKAEYAHEKIEISFMYHPIIKY